jgi:O-antigen/teichoic acid export membrane protein
MKLPRLVNGLFGSQLRRNIATGTGSAILGLLLGLASYPIYLHFLGYEQYGVWIALSTVLTVAQLGNFGINPAVSKLVAEAHGAGDMMAVRRCVTAAWFAVSVAGAAVVCAVLLLKRYIIVLFNVSGSNSRLMATLLPYVALFSVGIFIVESLNATLVGIGRMDLDSYFRICLQAIALICSTVLLFTGHGVESVLLGNAVAYLAMHVLSLVAVRQIVGSRLLTVSRFGFGELARLLNFGGWVFGASIVTVALSPFNRIVLSKYAGVATLPVYEIAFGSAMRVRSLLESGLRAMMPEISRIRAC